MSRLMKSVRTWCFLPVLVLAFGCASGDAPVDAEGKPTPADTVDEVPAIKVEDPCDCFAEGLSRGEMRYCRESKRDVAFLEVLRKCGTAEVGGVSALSNIPGDGQYTMNTDQSLVQWQGSKVGLVETGTIPFRSCTFQIKGSQLVSGGATVEMNALKVNSLEGATARQLAQHLRSEDFFDVAEHPTASFMFEGGRTDGRGNLNIEGKLNIKGISKPARATLSFGSSDPVVASINMVFNRADFDVRYGSGSFFSDLGDDLISDKVELKMVLIEDVSLRKVN